MLTSLKLQNVILIDACTIDFKQGLNIITGETGAGKSAIMHSIAALLGARADSSLVRKDSDAAIIEGIFDLPSDSPVWPLLDEAGIRADSSEPLIIRREISKKSRLWIQSQPASLALLCDISTFLAEQVDQGASQLLKSTSAQLNLLDTFGKHDLTPYQATLKMPDPQPIAPLQAELDEIEALALQENEEESLFTEHSRMANNQSLNEQCTYLTQALSEITSQFQPIKRLTKNLTHLDPSLEEHESLITSALCNLQEAELAYTRYLDSLEFCPSRFSEIETRLSEINRLKRKIGCSFEDLLARADELKLQIETAQNADQIRNELQQEQKRLANALTAQRESCAKTLSNALTEQLHSLNMPKAKVTIQIEKTPLTSTGQDQITFLLAANPGEAAIPIQSCASGGELSRLLLAIKLLLTAHTPTLIFDEIDSNIGGQTATLIGEKLKTLGQNTQVICITHFPQVAKQADHHLQITKSEDSGRTLTLVKELATLERKTEIERMMGLDMPPV
ncbi:MAG: DNA repair protein RecN [Chlamydiales bacterium]|nr:DNA repair protein RecN [Chlamydiales bacterium]